MGYAHTGNEVRLAEGKPPPPLVQPLNFMFVLNQCYVHQKISL